MGTTERGIFYPDSDDHTRLWEHFQTLAESVDAALEALDTTDGTPPWVSFTVAGAAGFSTTTARYMLVNERLVVLDLAVTRTGADIAMGSSGNISDLALTAALPVAIRPTAVRAVRFTRSGVMAGTVRVQVDGTTTLTDAYPNSSIPNGGVVLVHDVYALG